MITHSDHFSEEELCCHCCGELPEDGISPSLLEGLEKLRDIVGEEIHITNAYRCEKHNEKIGGVFGSEHTKGTAADIWCESYTVDELADICEEIFDSVGRYKQKDFVHVDMRDDSLSVGEYTWTDEE